MNKNDADLNARNNIKQRNFELMQKDKGFTKRAFYITDNHMQFINKIKVDNELQNQHEALRFIIEQFEKQAN